jgi:D-glycero-alpha-D-manno-heptose-7-phosphate kinase
MIVTRTPLRISLAGGGTDMPEFYRDNGGAVVSFAIDKYVYVCVNEKFDGGTRVSYSITENVDEPEQLKHDIARETLRLFNSRSVEVVSMSDIPGQGSGLGSSSAFAVGLNLALRHYTNGHVNVHPNEFAKEAYHIERDLCEHPVGKQDHYAAAYGGFRHYKFNKDDTVFVSPVNLSPDKYDLLMSRLMLFWIGRTRDGNKILKEQSKGLSDRPEVIEAAKRIRDNAVNLYNCLSHNDISEVGYFLDDSWKLKKELALGISNREIDTLYNNARMAGAEGGKLCGAGGSGFLLFYADVSKHYLIQRALGLRQIEFRVCNTGTSLIYKD